jgi:hypothetical protein
MNWGTKLVIALALFMAFILTLSVKMIFSNDDALIEKDYYEQGLNYNKKYNARQQAVADSVVPSVDVNENGLTISFTHPAECKLNFKRLSDAKMDTNFARRTDQDFNIHILEGDLKRGSWLLILNYRIDEKTYLHESEIIMP